MQYINTNLQFIYFFHLNSSFKCNIMIYVLALALSSNYQNNLVSRDTIKFDLTPINQVRRLCQTVLITYVDHLIICFTERVRD